MPMCIEGDVQVPSTPAPGPTCCCQQQHLPDTDLRVAGSSMLAQGVSGGACEQAPVQSVAQSAAGTPRLRSRGWRVCIPVVEGEGQEAAFLVVPVGLVPRDVLGVQELCPPQGGVAPPELDQVAARTRAEVSVLPRTCRLPQHRACSMAWRPGALAAQQRGQQAGAGRGCRP